MVENRSPKAKSPKFGKRPGGGKGGAGRGGKKPTGKPAAKPDRAPVVSVDENSEERIAKRLARAGVASRRDAERMIAEGRVSLNGEVLQSPAVNVTLKDRIEVDGAPIRAIERTRLWLYHKPIGLVTTHKDPEGRPTVFEKLPNTMPRVMSIGRLDINTEGLLLLTNDGGLARTLELPSTGWLRRYRVRAHGKIEQAELDRLQEGIAVDGVLYGGIEAVLDRVQGSNVWITMGLREGKNREIKNVLGALGLEVNRLIRTSYGPFQLGDMPEGGVSEVRSRLLREQLGERLALAAGANFDAPLLKHGPDAEKPERPPKDFKKSDGRSERAGDAKRGRPDGGDARGGKSSFGDDDKPQRKPAPQRNRGSNVWMAPGARPVGPAKAAKKSSGKPGAKTGAGKPKPRPAGRKPRGSDADRRR